MIHGVSPSVFWTVGAVSVALGLVILGGGERFVHCLRGWLLRQLRWIKTPGYRRYLKINGWLLLVLGALLLVLMATGPGRAS